MKIFDIGMYDAADTFYYLETGSSVVAVEANPALCAMAASKLERFVRTGQLTIVNAAISNERGPIKLHVCGQDLGSSSLYADRIAERFPLGSYEVPAIKIQDLLDQYGQPDFIKIDIEGADQDCVLSLNATNAPAYLSFEAGADLALTLDHACRIGYRLFKIIHQSSFRSFQRQDSIRDRAARRIIRWLGYGLPRQVKRNGRMFILEHSAGPAPWESDGRWYSLDQTLASWEMAKRRQRTSAWYDVHATKSI